MYICFSIYVFGTVECVCILIPYVTALTNALMNAFECSNLNGIRMWCS